MRGAKHDLLSVVVRSCKFADKPGSTAALVETCDPLMSFAVRTHYRIIRHVIALWSVMSDGHIFTLSCRERNAKTPDRLSADERREGKNARIYEFLGDSMDYGCSASPLRLRLLLLSVGR